MAEKSFELQTRPQPSRREVTDRINLAFRASDINETCRAIGDAIRLYNISDIAKESGIERPSIYRAFVRGPKHPNFKTVLSVLDAMGFQLQVSVRRDARARPARSKAASSSRTSKG